MSPTPDKNQSRAGQQDLLANTNPGKRFLVNRQAVDWVIALIVCLAVAQLWTCRTLAELDPAGRRAVFQTSSAIATALFGLTMTSISILMSNLDKPLGGFPAGMPTSLVRGLSRTMFGLMRASGVLLLTSLIFLIIDTQQDGGIRWVSPVLSGLAVVVGLRMTRVTYLLSRILPARNTK